jgi:DNA-binding FrmR family transcriptional regulator
VKQSKSVNEQSIVEADRPVPTENSQDTLTLSESTKNDIITRLRRIEGQARGIQRMVEEGRSCEDIIIQVAALKAAITQVGVAIAGSHLVDCVVQSVSSGEEDCCDKLAVFARLFSKLA